MKKFNVRVYGLCVNAKGEILLVKESYAGRTFTKFPGGGLEMGEGSIECLKREFQEELHWDIDEISHFYTTDFYQPSAFDDSQIISLYYRIARFGEILKFDNFFWKPIAELTVEELTFPIDKHVAERLIQIGG